MNNQEQHVSLNPVITLCPLKVPVNITWIYSLSLSLLITVSPLRLVIRPTVRGMFSKA